MITNSSSCLDVSKLSLSGGASLCGSVVVSGAKNAALPIIAASVLFDCPITLENVPNLTDVKVMCSLIENLKGVCYFNSSHCGDNTLFIDNADLQYGIPDPFLAGSVRASSLLLGPMLARFGKVTLYAAGGCPIGIRPLDVHLYALERMGANISIKNNVVYASASSGLYGADIMLSFASVGATENIITAAVLADGITVIRNAAMEPEIVDLVCMLNKAGANITGAGTATVTINGVASLGGCEHRIIADRIEAGTYAVAALLTNGCVELEGYNVLQHSVIEKLIEAGAIVSSTDKGVIVTSKNIRPEPINVSTAPYPGFPSDMQSLFLTLAVAANGCSVIEETIFENRFMVVCELCKMGADINIEGNRAVIRGVEDIRGCAVRAHDLRGAASLLLAGLVASGTTVIDNAHYLSRGYENIIDKLSACGIASNYIKKFA